LDRRGLHHAERTTSDFVPAYRKHKATGQAVVTLNGHDHYLGRHGSKESKTEYDRLIAEWLAGGRQLPTNADGLTVNEVLLAYLRFAEGYYGKDGKELGCLKDAIKPVKALFGREPADTFGPKRLKAVRQQMVDQGWCRKYVNHQTDRVRRIFKWAASEELVSGEVFHALQAVSGIRRGVPGVRESEPVKPAPEHLIEAARPFMPPPVRALVDLQLLTGMRPGEACLMRGCDLETSGRVWVYRPARHKTEHHGHERTVFIGPRAQEVVRLWLKTDLSAYLFSPAEAEQERNARKRAGRKTPQWPSHVKAQARKRKRRRQRAPGDRYDVAAYRRAIARACAKAFPLPEHLAQRPDESRNAWLARLTPEEKAGIRAWHREHSWHPHQLRHNAATNLRKEFGVELARIILGHATAFTTEIYAEADRAQAMEVIGRVG
jgi:integrase